MNSFFSVSIQPLPTRSVVNNGPPVTQARRSTSPPSESNSSSSSSISTSENPRKGAYDFPLPTTMNANKAVVKKSTNGMPSPPKLSFNSNSTHDDDDDNTSNSTSILSKRNATPAALNHLKNIEDIIRGGDETPRTRTILQKPTAIGNKDIPIEYDDESMSHSQISTFDDVTVDKASPSPSAHMDFFEDL